MSTENTNSNPSNTAGTNSTLPKKFENVSIARDEYRNVRGLLTDESVKHIESLDPKALGELRRSLDAKLKGTQNTFQKIDNKRTLIIRQVSMQYVPAEQQGQKKWAYQTALQKTIAHIDSLFKARNNVVSPLLTAQTAQAGTEPVSTEPTAVAAGTDTPAMVSDDLPA